MHYPRRFFLLAGAAFAAVGGASAMLFRPFLGPPPHRVLTAAEKASCGLTVEATEGPYHVTGITELLNGNLNYTGLPGQALEVSGYVFDGIDDSKPLANAVVEIWHADSDGSYHPNGNGAASRYQPDEIALRGYVLTDSQGRYSFRTIYPGEYTGRTRHLHFRIAAPGKPDLVTQLIVPARPGDRLNFDTDDIAEGLPNCQLLVLDQTVTPAKASFDFRV